MSENLRKVDCMMAPRGVWLLKVPRYLSEIWSAHDGEDVGKLLIKGDPRQGDVKLELISKPNLAANAISENLQKPQEEQKVVSHLENGQFVYIIKLSLAPQEHSFVFNNHPGHNMVLMKEDKTDLCEDACIKSGKISIQGKVVRRADCRPNDQKYMRMKIEQIHKTQKPKKFVQQLDRAAVKFKPVSVHDEEKVRVRQKKDGAKLHRADEDAVRNAIFHAFEKHQYYKLHDLQLLLQQPAGYLKGILTDIADYNTAPPHRSMWELKPEYRNYSINNPNDHPMILVYRLQTCLVEEDDICMDAYCELWDELCRFILRWGSLLKFVTEDVSGKIGGIREVRSGNQEKTATFKIMTTWEHEENKMRSHSPKSGTVNVLILHRAFDFIIGLIDGVYREEKENGKVSTIAREAYDKSLAKYHSWLVRKVVGAALLALPYKKDFISSMRGPMAPEEDHHFHGEFTRLAYSVKERISVVLESYKMTDFPKQSE